MPHIPRFMCGLIAVGTFWVASTCCLADEQRPNVVLILSDDQMWTDYGFMGHTVVKTPHLDKLAAESATFTAGYVPTSLCRPSLATLVTGLYPHEHGITGNDPPKGTDRNKMLKFIRDTQTVPELLGEKGYVSFQTGKWWEGDPSEGGFTAGMTNGDPTKGGRHGDKGLQIGREGLDPIWNFLGKNEGKPFFLWYAPFLPHQPHNPPQQILKKYQTAGVHPDVAKYYAMCEWFDQTCGELLGGLKDRGLSENTLIVYVCDNGWIQGTPQNKPAGWNQPFAPKSKRSPYDGGLRTPIMLCWPGKIGPRRFDVPISSIDIAPTILLACGIKPPAAMSGQNLLAVIDAGGTTERNSVYGEIFEHDLESVDDPTASLLFRWVRRDQWKLIEPVGDASPELYDLSEDPFEENNLAARRPDMLKPLRANLNAWWNPKP